MKEMNINGVRITLTTRAVKLVTKEQQLYIPYEDFDLILKFYENNTKL